MDYITRDASIRFTLSLEASQLWGDAAEERKVPLFTIRDFQAGAVVKASVGMRANLRYKQTLNEIADSITLSNSNKVDRIENGLFQLSGDFGFEANITVSLAIKGELWGYGNNVKFGSFEVSAGARGSLAVRVTETGVWAEDDDSLCNKNGSESYELRTGNVSGTVACVAEARVKFTFPRGIGVDFRVSVEKSTDFSHIGGTTNLHHMRGIDDLM